MSWLKTPADESTGSLTSGSSLGLSWNATLMPLGSQVFPRECGDEIKVGLAARKAAARSQSR